MLQVSPEITKWFLLCSAIPEPLQPSATMTLKAKVQDIHIEWKGDAREAVSMHIALLSVWGSVHQ